jgi:hypothetical protein
MQRKSGKSSTVVLALVMALYMASSALAQDQMLRRGTKELALSGAFDFENQGDPTIDLNLRYGFFIQNRLEVGGFAEVAGDFDNVFRYGLGGFGEYHFAPIMVSTVPYVGADVALAFVDTDLGEDNAALVFTPRVGLKWFLREFIAIDTNFFVALATDDLYENDQDDLDAYDIGMNLGLRFFFR